MRARLRSFGRMVFRRTAWERDLDDELQFHLEQRAEDLRRAGVSAEAARRRAAIEFGGVETHKDACRDARGAWWIDEARRNASLALRSLSRHPGVSGVAVLSLALGIGANLAVFALLQRLVLTPLPVRAPDELVQLSIVSSRGSSYGMPYPKFEAIRDGLDVFAVLFGWGRFLGPYQGVVAGEARRLEVAAVTGNYFEALGLRPAAGRLLAAADDAGSESAVIAYALWQAAFGGDATAIGQRIDVGGASLVVVGVAPAEFAGTSPATPPDLYLTLPAFERLPAGVPMRQRAGLQWFHVMGRLRSGVTPEVAQTILQDQWPRIDAPNRSRSRRNLDDRLVIEDGSRGYLEVGLEFSPALLVVMGLVAVVFVIACANLATLLSVRAARCIRETAICLAMGASRGQIVRQWVTEGAFIASAGGVAGFAVAHAITDVLLKFVPESDRPWLRFAGTPALVAGCVLLTALTVVMCGLLPGLLATGTGPAQALGAQTPTTTPQRRRAGRSLLAAQVAAATVLVAGALLFTRTLWKLNDVPLGFDRAGVVYGIPDFSAAGLPHERRVEVVADVLARLRRSGLVAAAGMGSPPMVWGDDGWGWITGAEGHTLAPDEDNTAWANTAAPGYFGVLGIPIVAGRDFEERDRPAASQRATTIVVNESLAAHYFGGRDAVGQRVVYGTPMEIIGVVRDTLNTHPRQSRRDVVYMPLGKEGWSPLVARPVPGVPPSAVQAEMRAALAAASPAITVESALLEDAVQKRLGRDRLVARLSAVLGTLGLMLAAIGLYATTAHSVASRSREIGIRLAVGAGRHQVLAMVLREGAGVVALGAAVGLLLAAASGHVIGSLLYDVTPADPVTSLVAAATLSAVGLAATWAPARRAARLDPARTLRAE